MRALIVVAASVLVLGGCVRVLDYQPLAPSRANAETAIAALQRSTYLRQQIGERLVYASSDDMVAGEGLAGCLAGGGDFHLASVELSDIGVCGLNDDGQRQCLAWNDMSAIAEPNDKLVVGYYPIRQDLDCDAT